MVTLKLSNIFFLYEFGFLQNVYVSFVVVNSGLWSFKWTFT